MLLCVLLVLMGLGSSAGDTFFLEQAKAVQQRYVHKTATLDVAKVPLIFIVGNCISFFFLGSLYYEYIFPWKDVKNASSTWESKNGFGTEEKCGSLRKKVGGRFLYLFVGK